METVKQKVQGFRERLDVIKNKRLALLAQVEKGTLDIPSFGAEEALLHLESTKILQEFKELLQSLAKEEQVKVA